MSQSTRVEFMIAGSGFVLARRFSSEIPGFHVISLEAENKLNPSRVNINIHLHPAMLFNCQYQSDPQEALRDRTIQTSTGRLEENGNINFCIERHGNMRPSNLELQVVFEEEIAAGVQTFRGTI